MREKYREEHEACNAIGALLSSRSWYEKFHNNFGGTPKMIGAIGGIDQGFRLPHPQLVNLDDHSNSIPKIQSLESLECQTPIFVDSNDLVRPKHTFNQSFDIVSFRTRACNLPSTKGKPNKKTTSKKWCLVGESPSIAKAIKKYSQIAKELELLKMQMTNKIMTHILKSEQVGRKLLL
jgi:hypothetical protein